jgi:hypothetical protein
VSAPILIRGIPISFGVSIGIASSPKDGREASLLMPRADLALYASPRELKLPSSWRSCSAYAVTTRKVIYSAGLSGPNKPSIGFLLASSLNGLKASAG